MNPNANLDETKNAGAVSAGAVDVLAVTTREDFAALVESCKACNLPAELGWDERRRAETVMRRAQGWLRSSFFSMQSSETQQHVAALLSVREARRHV
ncbi:hypothetical protein [Lysobacter enzymogenes]|uniref:hypothetical protein n=1 Tax=Lysobacter enzymogenes TaxID=69 RepID=UPI001A977431|nr:hypothetical protein [Lysobacter enzymogenes]QQP96514.1 hypothetical protein JHW38_00190 [Lysobacter enzymogenes]